MRPILLLLALAAPVAAQPVVTPAHFAAAEANTNSANGIAVNTTPSTLLSIYEDLQGAARTVKGVTFRVDGTYNQNAAASNLTVSVFASTAVTTAATPSATFASNHGADKTTVANLSPISWPPAVLSGPAPPFTHAVPFNQPFAFAGTGPLCVEVQVISRTNTTTRFDFASGASADPNPLTRTYGTGCIATGYTAGISATASGSGSWGSNSVTLTYGGSRLPKGAPIVVMIGADNTQIAGIPLPFVLPNTATAPSGPCTIYNDSIVNVPVTTTATGTISLSLGLTVNPFFNGLDVYGMLLAVDPPANFYGVVMSNGVQHHVIAPYSAPKIGTVYSNNSTGPNGTVAASQGYVTRIDA